MHKITTLCNILQLLSDYNEIKDEDAQDDARLAPEAIIDQRMPEEREVEDTSACADRIWSQGKEKDEDGEE